MLSEEWGTAQPALLSSSNMVCEAASRSYGSMSGLSSGWLFMVKQSPSLRNVLLWRGGDNAVINIQILFSTYA